MLQLETLIPCARAAERRMMEKGPRWADASAGRAIFALVALGAELPSLNGTPLHERLERLWQAEEESSGERDRFSEIVTEELFAVGFTSFPASSRELLEKIVSRIESESNSLAE